MKMMMIVLTALVFNLVAHADMPHTKEELAFKITLENQFTSKLEKVHPKARSMVVVTMNEPKKVTLDLIGDATSVGNQERNVIDQIQNVKVFSEDTVTADELAELFEVPVQKITFKQLEPYQKAQATSTPDNHVLTFGERVRQMTENYYQLLVMLGAVGLIIGLFKIASGIAAAAKTAMSQPQARPAPVEAPRAPQAYQDNRTQANGAPRKWTPIQTKAMFAEAYWTQQDSLAAALVRSHPNPAYSELRFGKEYQAYLTQVSGGNLAVFNETFFLNPDPIFQEMSVEDTPADLASECSELRFEQLKFTATDLIRAKDRNRGSLQVAIQSPLRKLPMVYRVKFKDVTEEAAVLSSSEFNESVKLSLPSLYTLSRLDDAAFEHVMQAVSASELAEAWIGPDSILSQIESRLSARKREVFSQLKGAVVPARDTVGFQKILKLCREGHGGFHQVESEDRAA